MKEIPCARLLKIFSWILAAGGMAGGMYIYFYKIAAAHSLAAAAAVVVVSCNLAVITRMIGNAGQMIFDIKSDMKHIIFNSFPEVRADICRAGTDSCRVVADKVSEKADGLNENISRHVLMLLAELEARTQILRDDLEAAAQTFTEQKRSNPETSAGEKPREKRT